MSATYYLVKKPICWEFILAEFFIVIIGRYVAIMFSYLLFSFFPGSNNNKLTLRQLIFTAYAALIRGSIAFGLILKTGDLLDDDPENLFKANTLESSTCFLVVITTLVFGGLTPPIQRCVLPPSKADQDADDNSN